MDIREARRMFKICQPYFEINDKFVRLLWTVPDLLLPIPKVLVEEVFTTIANSYQHMGKELEKEYTETLGFDLFYRHKSCEEALSSMAKIISMTEADRELKANILLGLKESEEIFKKNKIKLKNPNQISAYEAQLVVKAWNGQKEFNEKIEALGWYLPESFLPYPRDVITESLRRVETPIKRIINKFKDNHADKVLYLDRYCPDSMAITKMAKYLKELEENNSLKIAAINRLRDIYNKWVVLK